MPKTRSGKWSVWLNAFFVIVIVISVALVNVLGVLSYDDHWWDATVPILALATITAFILGIIAIIKKRTLRSCLYISHYRIACYSFYSIAQPIY